MQASAARAVMHTVLGRGLTTPQVEQLAQASVGRNIAAGHALMTEGDRPTGLVLLLEGRVEILKRGRDGQQQSLGKVDAPTVLGEMSLITERPTSATVMAYSLYTFSAENLPRNHSMMLTIPFVLYGIFRYLYLVYRKNEGGSPEQVLLTDRPLLACILLWLIACLVILYL